MGKYGKQCKKDSDCPSKICEMTYFNNDTKRPDSRKCVNMSYKSLDIEGGINVINKKKSVFTSKKCSFNSDCASGICDDNYDINGKNKGTYCVDQEKKFGKECQYNADCESYICAAPNKTDPDYDPSHEFNKKCIIYDNPPDISNPNREFGGISESDLPEEMQDPKWKETNKGPGFINPKEKAKELQGRGPIADLIILLMEYVAVLIQGIIQTMILVWKIIFMGISFIFTYIFELFKFAKWKCSNKTFKIPAKKIAKFFAVLFPPYGVFLHLGASALPQILIACILSMFIYIPGILYAWSIIDTVPKPTVEITRVPVTSVLGPFNPLGIMIALLFPNWTIDPLELYNMFFHGQLIKDGVCIPMFIVNTTVTVFMPPLGLYMKQKEIKEVNMRKIIVSLILTGIFYFPGLFYSLHEQKKLKKIHKINS